MVCILTTIADEDVLHGEKTLCNVLASLWIANQTKQPGPSNVNLESRTLRRVSPPGVVASSLSTASLRARTSSIGVRGRVRKKFMASEVRRRFKMSLNRLTLRPDWHHSGTTTEYLIEYRIHLSDG
jgi:hypothetical protein